MSAVILGAGTVGFRLAQQLIEEQQDVVLIEKDPQQAERASDALDCLVINDIGNSIDTLRRAGTAKADHFVAVTNSDEMNMLACGIVAGEFPGPKKIARVRNVDYWNTNVIGRSILGIDYIVSPEIEVAQSIVNAVDRGAVSDVMFFEKTGLQMRSIGVASDSPFVGRSIEESRRSIEAHFLVAVIYRSGEYLIPSGVDRVYEGDRLYLIATDAEFDRVFSSIGVRTIRINRIALVGAGRIGQYVLEHLLESSNEKIPFWKKLFGHAGSGPKRRITVIERDYDTCKLLAQRYPDAMVINADITDDTVSEDELFPKVDLLIATTANQELNIVTAVYAKTLGTSRSIALVNKASYVHIANGLNIDIALSPTDSMVNTILKYIRKANVQSLHTIGGGNIEVLEMTVRPESAAIDTSLRDLKLPSGALVISLFRNKEHIVPSGDLVVREHDNLVIIANRESLPALERVFTG
jgi:trk system potassium uptake protein